MVTVAPTKAYGEGRSRAGVSYVEVERAAIAILKSERRPAVESLREALGGGSPDTIATALKRFWRDLGARIDGDPAALTRMPADIADLAEGMWQRALKLAAEAAQQDDNAARERLRQLQVETEIRQHSFALREQEMDTQARERERMLIDARDHLLSVSKALSREQATNQAQERRIADLETEVAHYRQQIGGLIAGAIAEDRQRPQRRAPTPAKPPSAVRTSPRSIRPALTPGKLMLMPHKSAANKPALRRRRGNFSGRPPGRSPR